METNLQMVQDLMVQGKLSINDKVKITSYLFESCIQTLQGCEFCTYLHDIVGINPCVKNNLLTYSSKDTSSLREGRQNQNQLERNQCITRSINKRHLCCKGANGCILHISKQVFHSCTRDRRI
jgi:hypothetical protein